MDGDQFWQIHGPESRMLGVSTVLEMFKGVNVGSESLNNLPNCTQIINRSVKTKVKKFSKATIFSGTSLILIFLN